MHVRQNKFNGCRGKNCSAHASLRLPASTFGTSVPYTNSITKHYSIFATLKFQQIDGMMRTFRYGESYLNNFMDGLSPSNISILSLPLLMAIPRISLLEQFFSIATAWHVFATDILAGLPLLIKGIELVIAYTRSTVRMVWFTRKMVPGMYTASMCNWNIWNCSYFNCVMVHDRNFVL